MIKNIAFDCGGVLIFTNDFIDNFLCKLTDQGLTVSRKEFLSKLTLAEQGSVSLSDSFSSVKNLNSLWEDSLKSCCSYNHLLLKYIKFISSTISVGIVSNVDSILAQSAVNLRIYNKFENVILSCTSNVAKPDTKIFSAYTKLVKLKPNEILFIDDNINYLSAAGEFGFNTHRFLKNSETIPFIDSILNTSRHEKLNTVK